MIELHEQLLPAGGPWTTFEDLVLRAMSAAGRGRAEIAEFIGRCRSVVNLRLRRLGVAARRGWSNQESARIRELHGTITVPRLAAMLGRSESSTHQKIRKLGLSRARPRHGEAFEAFIRDHHALGWSDTQMAEKYSKRVGYQIDRHNLARWRRRLGLASVLHSEHQRDRVRQKTGEQLRTAGLKSLAEVRAKAWRDAARALGWPEDLGPRHLQVLHALYTIGPMTRRELAHAIGMPWKGSRKSLHSNDPEGSLLGHLAARALVINLGRINTVVGKGCGFSTCVYTLPLHVQPNPQLPASAPEGTSHAA